MLAAIVTAAVVSATPTPSDLLAAHADVHAPPGTPAITSPSPRARLAMLAALVAADALDRDAPDYRWFSLDMSWESELGFARGLVSRVRTCPTLAEGAWVPPAGWFRDEAAAYGVCAAAWRRRAEEYRERAEWEADRAEPLLAWARYMEAQADGYSDAGWRVAGLAGGSWCRPRRVVLAEVREWVGEAAWQKRQWPGE